MPVFRVEKNSNYTTMCNYHLRDQGLSLKGKVRWSSFFVTLTRKSFDIIMPAFFFQMVSYIHLMNVGGYDCNTHIHNP